MRIIFDLVFACPRCGHKLRHKHVNCGDDGYYNMVNTQCPECGSFMSYSNCVIQGDNRRGSFALCGIPCKAWIYMWKNHYHLVEGFECLRMNNLLYLSDTKKMVPLLDWINCIESRTYFKPSIRDPWAYSCDQINYAMRFIRYRNVIEKVQDYISFKRQFKEV